MDYAHPIVGMKESLVDSLIIGNILNVVFKFRFSPNLAAKIGVFTHEWHGTLPK